MTETSTNEQTPTSNIVETAQRSPSLQRGRCDENEELFRMARIQKGYSPNNLPQQALSDRVFAPRPNKDKGCLSVSRGSMIDPEEAHRRFHQRPLKGAPYYCFAVSVQDCYSGSDAVRLKCDPSRYNDAHALIDFNPIVQARRMAFAKHLKRCAIMRGVLYPI